MNFEIPILTFIPVKIDADELRQQFGDLSELAMVEEEDIDTEKNSKNYSSSSIRPRLDDSVIITSIDSGY